MAEKLVIIFGFSGSGKSSIANMVGKRYGLRVIHPSGILRDLCQGKAVDLSNTQENTGFWETKEGIRLFKKRLHEERPLDVVSDRILIKEAKKGNVIIDSWNLPWLIDNGKKIYLKADLKTRALRVAQRDGIVYKKAVEIVSMKDKETRKLFKRLYGFDIKQDCNVFDCIINTNNLNKNEVFKRVCNCLDRYI